MKRYEVIRTQRTIIEARSDEDARNQAADLDGMIDWGGIDEDNLLLFLEESRTFIGRYEPDGDGDYRWVK